jgi:hypothetical protein
VPDIFAFGKGLEGGEGAVWKWYSCKEHFLYSTNVVLSIVQSLRCMLCTVHHLNWICMSMFCLRAHYFVGINIKNLVNSYRKLTTALSHDLSFSLTKVSTDDAAYTTAWSHTHRNESSLIKSGYSRTSVCRSDLILGREFGMGARWVQLKLRHGVTVGHACRISLSDATEKLIIMEVVSSVRV